MCVYSFNYLIIKFINILKRVGFSFIAYDGQLQFCIVIFKDINWENCFDLIKNDKKVKDGKINWVLLKSLGNSFTKNDISEDILMEIVREQ